MSESSKVRFSRDGDQFHYLWAARRCLRLLSPASGLVAISIEGPSLEEIASGDSVEAGEELIDVGEYYGSEDLEKSTFVRYIQLKHSTQTPAEPWVPSGLEKTLRGFAKRYKELEDRFGAGKLDNRVEFIFVTNRPINSDFLETIEDSEKGTKSRHPNDLIKLEKFTSFTGDKLSTFCKILKLEGGHEAYRLQRTALALETKSYLPDDDVDAPIQLKELVTKKALSESESNPSITKIDVLRALGTTEEKLFPAPSRIETVDNFIPRVQETELISKIVHSTTPVIIHAAGGVGKSVLSQRIKLYLPDNSVVIVYDCFGNGEYRRPGSPRHRHKDALVQIANELARLGLCDPLIPSSRADNTDYLKAFAHRVGQSIAVIKEQNPQSLLCIAIDAADNAEMAAEEFGGERSFVRDLLRESMPDGVRLVAFCRTERQGRLHPPPSVLPIELKPFSRDETATLLRQTYADASENDVDEFHRLTSQNPRVQATALTEPGPLSNILMSLGPNPTTVDALFEQAINKIREERIGQTEQLQVDSICAALAILRPLIPITVLAKVSGVQDSTIKSFATDLGRPLLLLGDSIQFRDEPAETWFRERFRPSSDRLYSFIGVLHPLSSTSSYVASTLPQLMLEAGQLSELVELALSSASLPSNPIEKRDVEIQRLQFALKASLRAKRHVDAAKLALKAGEETAGDSRQQKLFQDNTDLVAALVEPDRIQEIISRKTFSGGWVGAHHAYEAGLLSHVSDFRGDALSRLRMAHEWLRNWSQLPKKEREHEHIADNDIAEMAIAQFNLYGPKACAADLRGWTPKRISYDAGRIIAQRFIDHSRYDDLNELAINAPNDLYLLLAITLELRKVHRNPPKESVERALCLVLQNVKIDFKSFHHEEMVIQAITSLVESAYSYRLRDNIILASILARYLPDEPPHGLTSRHSGQRFSFLRAYALSAALNGCDLILIDLARPEIRKQLEDTKSLHDSRDIHEFKENVGALLPWHKLWAKNLLAPVAPAALLTEIGTTQIESASASRSSYREDSSTSDEIVEIWLDILIDSSCSEKLILHKFTNWTNSLKRPLYTATLIKLARLSARTNEFQSIAYEFSQRAYKITNDAKEDSGSKAQTYIDLARAILSTDLSEAREYFNRAVEVASKIGDEIFDRWHAMLDLADRAADAKRPVPETAYRLARSAEVAEDYDSKHFDWNGTMTAISGLCPSSGLAIMSRWRDRNVGWLERLFPITINYLLDHRYIDPKLVPALVGFRAQWEYCGLVEKSFEACDSHCDREVILNHVLHYMQLEKQSLSIWEDLRATAELNQLNVSEIDQFIEYAKHQETSKKKANNSHTDDVLEIGSNHEKKNWDVIFNVLELHTTNGLSKAYDNFKSSAPPYYPEKFFAELFKRITIGKEVELIRLFPDLANFDLYHFRSFLEQVPDAWKSRMAIKSALADTTKRFLSRYCMEITKSRYYQQLPLQTASELSGILEKDLIDVVLTSIGEANEIVESGRLFTLVGLLAGKLSHHEALEALNYSLDLFDSVLDVNDGDGAWTPALKPPTDINAAIAGYIWAALAAPETSLRWEAAHVVRGLCTLGGQAVLGHLIALSYNNLGGPFTDARLHFYHLHARQWLLIALARSAMESPGALAPYESFFIHFALNDEPHVLIRHFASNAALSLATSGIIQLDPRVVDQLVAVNKSSLPVTPSKNHERHKQHVHPMHRESGSKRFSFDYDFSKDSFASLGDCFAMCSYDIESEGEKVICDDWQLSENGHWDSDSRARRGYFRDGEFGSHSRKDNLSFYLSYHAMMTVAGKLLATLPLHQDPDYSEDEFNDWLNRYLLSRRDGCWLSDRRDPTPLDWPSWKDEKQDDIWRWSVDKSDFDRVLGLDEERLSLWGRWTFIEGRRTEHIHVGSALVSSDRSASLLRALQTATNPHNYRIPVAGDNLEIDELGFQLKGWIEVRERENRLDEFDPWAGEIRYPPLKPAKFVRDLIKIEPDRESRIWCLQSEGILNEALWSQVWGFYHIKNDESEAESGQRLQASHKFIAEFLNKMNMDLVVEVEIERNIRRHSYESYKDDGLGYIPPYSRIFILKANGDSHVL